MLDGAAAAGDACWNREPGTNADTRAETATLHGAAKKISMGNSSSTNKISAQDKSVPFLSCLPLLVDTMLTLCPALELSWT
jgi:hypothetical protein